MESVREEECAYERQSARVRESTRVHERERTCDRGKGRESACAYKKKRKKGSETCQCGRVCVYVWGRGGPVRAIFAHRI